MKSIIFNLSIIFFLFFNSINVNSQNCIDFSDTILNRSIPVSQANYTTCYTNGNIVFQCKYHDDTQMNDPGGVNIGDVVANGYVNSNSNYSNNIFFQGNAITKIDFSNISYQQKSISFDINVFMNENSDNPFYVNGNDTNNLPTGVSLNITNLTNGKHVELNGDISFIEIHGFEIAIDNLCVDSVINSSYCIDFNDTAIVNLDIPTSQTNFITWYTNNNIVFQSVYNDDLNMGNNGVVTIDDYINSGYGSENSNFSNNIFYQGNVITKIDFSNISYQQKNVSFDINYILNENSDNPFYVNGNDTNNLPIGISLNITNLTNGKHVELNGDISFIEMHGFETAIDNLCVDIATVLPINNNTNNFINLFPNPVNTDLQIKWGFESKVASLELYNIAGKSIMFVEEIYGNSYILNVSSLKVGIYFLRFKSDKNIIIKKIIKQ